MGEASRRQKRGCTCGQVGNHAETCPTAPRAVPKFKTETINLPVHVAKRVTEEYDLSPYNDRLTRAEYMALLVEAATEHEAKLRDQKAMGAPGTLIEIHKKLPEGIAEASARLEAIKKGVTK